MIFTETTLDHLHAVKRLLLRTLALMLAVATGLYMVKTEMLSALMAPLRALPHAPTVMVTGVPELFFIYMKVCTWGAVFVGLPWLFFEVWRFVAPALYPAERKAVWPLLVAVPVLFYGGGALAYGWVVPAALGFFFSFTQPGLVAQPTLTAYLGFLTSTAFAFGLALNMPLVLLLLMKIGLVTSDQLRKSRRFVIVLVFVVAAVLTPPDPVSQIALALPLWGLFELAVWLGGRMSPRVLKK